MGGISICLSVRLSVTLPYYVKTRERRRMQSLPPNSTVPLVFWCQEWLIGDDPARVKFECKEVDPCENSRAVHFSPHNSGNVIDSENSSVNLTPIESRTWAFQRAINEDRASLLTSPKWCSDAQICRFSRRNFDKKPLQVCYKVSFCLKTSSDKVLAQSTTYRTVSAFWQGMTPFR